MDLVAIAAWARARLRVCRRRSDHGETLAVYVLLAVLVGLAMVGSLLVWREQLRLGVAEALLARSPNR